MSRSMPLLVLLLLTIPAGATLLGQVTPLLCESDLGSATTIDFEGSGAPTVNPVLADFDMTCTPDKILTTLVFWVVGSDCGPLSNLCGFGDGFVLESVGAPWSAIGLSALGTILYDDRTFTLNAYDEFGALLGSTTAVFDAGSDMTSYNDGAVFIGVSSPEPIYSVQLLSDNPNIAWDSVRYCPFGSACTPPTGGTPFVRGDVNDDATVDISDPVFALAALFVPGSPSSDCADAADVNDDGVLDISDAVFALAGLFVPGAPPPPAPSGSCGDDPTADSQACDVYESCP